MSKRLILILALAFVVGITAAAFAEVQNVKVSGDLTVLGASRELQLNQASGYQSTDRSKFIASIARVRIDADLTDNVMTTVRLIQERYWGNEGDNGYLENPDSDSTVQVDLDLAYATMKEFLYSPLTLTIGRQELHFGNDMIIGDPYTNNVAGYSSVFYSRDGDLSARRAFDAFRATLNYDPLVIDLVASKISENQFLEKDDDTNLYGVNASYALSKKTKLEGYWFEKETQKKAVVTKNKAETVHTLGARVVTELAENLSAQVEGAYQMGRDNISTTTTVKRSAIGLEAMLTQGLPKVKYTPTLTALYAYFTGQKGDINKVSHAWDPMFENQTTGHIANALFNQSNAHILGGIVTAKPKDDVTLKGEYYAYWWDKVYGESQSISTARGESVTMQNKKFVGSEIDLTATYDYTEDVQFGLLAGFFMPSSAFDKGNRNVANELIGSMKVTF